MNGRRAVPTLCRSCGAARRRVAWGRRGRRPRQAEIARAAWQTCPACRHAVDRAARGRVVMRGGYARAHLGSLRRCVLQVCASESGAGAAGDDRLVALLCEGDRRLHAVTSSQRLAGRIAQELIDRFGGRVRYDWSELSGRLYATWERPAAPAVFARRLWRPMTAAARA